MPNHGLTFTPRGRGRVGSPHGTGGVRSRYLPFSEHSLSKVQTFQRFLGLSPFFSYSCALFCTFLHSCKTQPICFQAIPYSLRNTRGALRANISETGLVLLINEQKGEKE